MSRSHASRRKPSSDALLVATALAVGVHVAVLSGLDAAGGPARPRRAPELAAGTAPGSLPPPAPLRPSCDGDALLMAAARAMACAAPTVADGAACLADVDAQLQRDFVLCHAQAVELPPVEVVIAPPERIAAIEPIEAEALLDELTPEQLQQHQEQLQQLAAQPPPPPPPAVPPPPKPPLETQVIETVKPDKEEVPDDARFLSDHDSKVDKQTVARGAVKEDISNKPSPEELARKPDAREANRPEPPPDEPPAPDKKDAPPEPGKLAMRRPGSPEVAEVPQERRVAGDPDGADGPEGDGARPRKGDGAVSQDERKPTEASRGDGAGGGGEPRAPNLRATEEIFERVVGGGSVDHVEDVEEGEENAFNSKKWIYASFFNRVKRQVAQTWDPASVWLREDPTGSVHGTKTRVTRVRVALDARGELRKIVVVSASGAPVLDEEAVRAFRAAGPFPNPPQALVDADGMVGFGFSFHFEIGERPSWKIYRSQ